MVVACYPNLEGYDLDVSDLPAKRLAMIAGDGDTSQSFQTCLNIRTSVYDRLNYTPDLYNEKLNHKSNKIYEMIVFEEY